MDRIARPARAVLRVFMPVLVSCFSHPADRGVAGFVAGKVRLARVSLKALWSTRPAPFTRAGGASPRRPLCTQGNSPNPRLKPECLDAEPGSRPGRSGACPEGPMEGANAHAEPAIKTDDCHDRRPRAKRPIRSACPQPIAHRR